MGKAINIVWTCIVTTTPYGKTTWSGRNDISIINEYPNAQITLETYDSKPYILIRVIKP